MKTISDIIAKSVLVYQGKEITASQFEALSPEERGKVIRKSNGPHHNARWAKDVLNRDLYKRHKQHYFGTPVSFERHKQHYFGTPVILTKSGSHQLASNLTK
jgi:hypothetical protein